MSRQELEQQIAALQERNRKLTAQVQLQDSRNKELQSRLQSAVVSTELEEEHIANGLIRRLDSMQKEKDELARQLRDEERKKLDQEALLARLKKSRISLERHLKQEDAEIREKLQHQLAHVQQQRIDMQAKVQAESATLQQLHQCVRSLRDVTPNSPAVSPAKPPAGAIGSTTALEGSSSSAPPLFSCGAAPVTSDDELSRSPSRSAVTSGDRNTTPLGIASADGRLTPSFPGKVERRSFAGDNNMVRILEAEIAVAEALHKETRERLSDYQRRISQLQAQVHEAEAEREAQRHSLEGAREEYNRTAETLHELTANQEVLAEWTVDRELLQAAGPIRSSSACSSMSTRTVETTASDWPDGVTPRVLHGKTAVESRQ